MSRFRVYAAPLLASLLLLAALALSIGSPWREARDSHLRSMLMVSYQITRSFIIHFTQHTAPAIDLEAASRLLKAQVYTPPELRHAALLQDGREIVRIGAPLGGLPPETPAGMRLDSELLVVWQPVAPADYADRFAPPFPAQGGPPPEGGPPRLRPPQMPDPVPEAPSGAAILVMGFATRPPPHVVRPLLRDRATRALLGVLGIGALAGVWSLSIRARGLRLALALESSRRSHLEELSLAAAGLAHETKNPLGVIRGLAQHIAREPGATERTHSMAEQIMDAADRAAVRLGEFIAYARPRPPRLEPVDTRALLRRGVELLEPDAEEIGVTLETLCTVDRIEADEEMLLQILLNLLLNSLQASRTGGRVRVLVERTRSGAALLVEDQGQGIPPELLPDIFKPYVTGRPDGHGLGLSIVQRLACEQGWTVEVHSQPGHGATVRIGGIRLASMS